MKFWWLWGGWLLACPVWAAEFTDDMGRKVVVPDHPKRIISISPSVTEILFAVGAGDQLIADTEYCLYPPAALTLPKIGGSMTPNIEQLVAMKPDLVMGDTATTLSKDRLLLMERAGLPVVMFHISNMADVLNRMGIIGALCGVSLGAHREVEALGKRLQIVREKVKDRPKPKVLLVVWAEPLWTMGHPTYINDAIEIAGGVNIAGDLEKQGVTFSMEEVIKRDPDVIVLSFHNASAQDLPPSWKLLRAIKAGRYVVIPNGYLVQATPRLVDGIEEMAKYLHPDAFKN